MVLELFEDSNDGVKRGTETVKRTSRKRYVAYRMSKIHDDENEPGVVRRIFNAIEPDICSKFRLSNPSKLASPSSLFFSFCSLAVHQQPRGPVRPLSLLQRT